MCHWFNSSQCHKKAEGGNNNCLLRSFIYTQARPRPPAEDNPCGPQPPTIRMTKILIVDDEQDLCEILRFNLANEGFDPVSANSAEEALSLLERDTRGSYGLILLDVMMDRMSGFEMARHLRERGDNTPIIFLTAKEGHDDQLEGFSAGADDYITKPFSFDTVLARIKAVLKRSQPAPATEPLYRFGSLTLDTALNRVSAEGHPVELTKREYQVLQLMARRTGEYLSREEILAQVWPNDAYVTERSVDVHIARLRKKLGTEGARIVNKTGFGYTLKDTPDERRDA